MFLRALSKLSWGSIRTTLLCEWVEGCVVATLSDVSLSVVGVVGVAAGIFSAAFLDGHIFSAALGKGALEPYIGRVEGLY